MTRAEKRAFEKYPKLYGGSPYGPLPIELNIKERQLFIEGYEQAERDTIGRAVEWLEQALSFGIHPCNGHSTVMQFKEAMEKEETE